MIDIKDMCSSKNGHHGFIDQTACVQLVMTRSSNPDLLPSNPYIGLYNSEAEKLIEDVANHRISEASADVELQKTYLDVLARQSAANESAARIRALEQQEVLEQHRLAADAEKKKELQQQQEEQQAAAQVDVERMRHECEITMMTRTSGGYGFNASAVSLCRSDPYAHLRPENRTAPQRQINCFGTGNMVNCTEQ